MRKKFWFLILSFLIIFLIFPSIKPLLKADFFPMHDFTHVARLVELDQAIKDDHFPPRWSRDLGWGYGMPLFHFYAPLPYYLAEVFHLVGFSYLVSIKLVFGLSFFVAFAGMYLFSKKFWGRRGSFLSALAFVYSPYRALDFYVRGALGELFSISLIPWVLWGITELVDKKNKKSFSLSSLFFGLFLLSHTILNLISVPMFLLFSLFYVRLNKSFIKKLIRVIKGLLAGVGVASFFLLPAFLEKKYAQIGRLTSGFSYYGHHFLFLRQFFSGRWSYGGSIPGPNDDMAFFLGGIQLILAGLGTSGTLIYFLKKAKAGKRESMAVFSLTFIIVLAFISTNHSKPIWDAIPLMAFIQFPWRFNSLIIVFLSFLAGGAVDYMGKRIQSLALVFLIFAGFLLIKTNLNYFQPQIYSDPQGLYYADKKLIQKQMSGIIPDYLPIWVKNWPQVPPGASYQIISGSSQINLLEDKTQKLVFQASTEKAAKIQVNRFYFPGWHVFVNGEKTEINYDNSFGLISFDLPDGDAKVEVALRKTPLQTASEIISFFSIIILLFVYVI